MIKKYEGLLSQKQQKNNHQKIYKNAIVNKDFACLKNIFHEAFIFQHILKRIIKKFYKKVQSCFK